MKITTTLFLLITIYGCQGNKDKKTEIAEMKVNVFKERNSYNYCQLEKKDTVQVHKIIEKLKKQSDNFFLNNITSKDFSFDHSLLSSSIKEAFLHLNKGEVEFRGEKSTLIISIVYNYFIEEIEDGESNSSEKTLILYFKCENNKVKIYDLSIAG